MKMMMNQRVTVKTISLTLWSESSLFKSVHYLLRSLPIEENGKIEKEIYGIDSHFLEHHFENFHMLRNGDCSSYPSWTWQKSQMSGILNSFSGSNYYI